MTFVGSLGLLLPAARPTTSAEVASAPNWRAVCECPGEPPAEMAIEVGSCALATAELRPADVEWLIHCGSGYQGATGWPVHHHIQHGIIGNHGNAVEVRQYCAGGLTSWLVADRLADPGTAVVCTAADNWSWDDRFATSRSVGGEPFSDVAHAAVLSTRSGFARIVGTGTASCPDQTHPWQSTDAFHEHATMADFRTSFSRFAGSRKRVAARDSFDMLARAAICALKDAQISPQYVTHFVPHSSHSGEPYRSLAKAIELPWAESLHQNNLDHGYLGVSTQMAGLVRLAETAMLRADSIVLLLAAEYQLSATAIVLHIIRPPVLSVDGPVHTLHE